MSKPKQSGYIVLLVTTGTREQAQTIASALLTRKKAACVNIVPEVHSLFRWQGKLDSAQESLLIIKTRASLLDQVVATVRENHRYQVPEIVALPVVGGNQDYMEWIDKELK